MATYVNDLRLKEIATGDESGTWGTSTNTNLELIAEAFSFGTEAITTNADTHATTIADGSTDPGRSIYLKYTGTLDSACTITIGPNTVSKLWFIENGTSGSQNIIISQGSGANVTIPAGHVKAVYSDGAGSGAAMVDAFTNLNLGGTTTVDDLTISDDLTVTDDMTIGGTLGVTGIVTLTDDLIIGDGKTIGSASDVDAMTIASNGQVTFSQTLIGTALDISGDIDVDGTTNLDVVDIDGAVDMASTLAVGGAVTANAGVSIDNITIDGTEIDLSSGDLTIDVAGDIILDADGSTISMKDGGTNRITFNLDSTPDLVLAGGNASITASTSDADFTIIGNDGGSDINALTFDMSAAGAATFNDAVTLKNTLSISSASTSGFLQASSNVLQFGTSSNNPVLFFANNAESMRIDSSGDVNIGTTGAASGSHKLVVESASTTGTVNSHIALIGDSATIGQGPQILFSEAGDGQAFAGGTIGFTRTGSNSQGALLFGTRGSSGDATTTTTERMRIDSSGNLGIGTTSPVSLLSLQGDAELLRLDGTANTTRTIFFRNTTAANPAQIHSDGSLKLRAEDSGTHIEFHTVDTERMRIDSSGRVSIGTSTTDRELKVQKSGDHSVIATVSGTSNLSGLVMGDTDDDDRGAVLYDNSGDFLKFLSAATERMRIHSGGQLTVGTTSTTIDSSNFGILLNGGNGRIKSAIDVGATGNVAQFFGNAGEFRIKGDGDVQNTNNSYAGISDQNLKENIVDATNKLDDINQVQIRNYNFIGSDHKQIGVIAQELESVFPSLVKTDDEGIKSVKYSVFVPILIKAVQEQQEQIESLKSEIANLKEK